MRSMIASIKEVLRASAPGRRLAAGAMRDYFAAQAKAAMAARLNVAGAYRTSDITVVVMPDDRAELVLNCVNTLNCSPSPPAQVICVGERLPAILREFIAGVPNITPVECGEGMSNLAMIRRAVSAAKCTHAALVPAHIVPSYSFAANAASLATALADTTAAGGILLRDDGLILEAGVCRDHAGELIDIGACCSPDDHAFQFARRVETFVRGFLIAPTAAFEAIFQSTTEGVSLINSIADAFTAAGWTLLSNPTVVGFDVDSVAARTSSAAVSVTNQQSGGDIRVASFPGGDYVDPPCAVQRGHQRILVIDDRVPHKMLGRGYPRANLLLKVLVDLGHRVTLYPLLEPQETWLQAYSDIPRDVEVLMGYGEAALGEFIETRLDRYDCVIVSRPHNMERFRYELGNRSPLGSRLPQLVYDAEALFAMRDVSLKELTGERLPARERDALLQQEVDLARGCHAVLVVSALEADEFRRRDIPNVIVMSHATTGRPTARPFADRNGLLFVGALAEGDSPNSDGLFWFNDTALPILRQRLLVEPLLTIAGPITSSRHAALVASGNRVLGQVDDLEHLYDTARVFIAPMRYGAGIPLKICEAAAYGIPIVTTSLAASQLGWKKDVELLVADSCDEFAAACVRLHEDSALWTRLRLAALDRLSREHSLARFTAAAEQALAPATGNRAQAISRHTEAALK